MLSCVWLSATPMDCRPPGSSVHGIFQARILEWVAMPSSRGSSRPRDWTPVSWVSCRQNLYHQHHLNFPEMGKKPHAETGKHRHRTERCWKYEGQTHTCSHTTPPLTHADAPHVRAHTISELRWQACSDPRPQDSVKCERWEGTPDKRWQAPCTPLVQQEQTQDCNNVGTDICCPPQPNGHVTALGLA